MQATINLSLDVPQTYGLETLKKQLTEYAKELVAKTKPVPKVRKHYAHDVLCGLAMTKSSDEELLDGYLKDKYNV